MSRVDFGGVLSAVNAFTLHDDGRYAYLFDPRVDATIRIDLSSGQREVLKWYDHGYHHRRWLCYCMFTMHRDDATYLPTLFFNTKRKMFYLVTFMVDTQKNVLYKLQENLISVEPIRSDRLAYNAHKDESQLHIIFYERFMRHTETPDEPLSFVFCAFNCQTLRLSTKRGSLPSGQWELPFVAHQRLHFISTERSTTQLATMAVEGMGNAWEIRAVTPDNNDLSPPRKAVWCNAWRSGMAWYMVCEKVVNEFEVSRTISIWQLDVLDCRWRKLPVSLNTPVTAANFALRIELNNIAYLHADWERDAVFHKFDLNELMSQRDDSVAVASEEEDEIEAFLSDDKEVEPGCSALSTTEIICPICMETYDDPRTLSCGHSVCFNCAEQMRTAAQSSSIRCFACRKVTTIPSGGLPINFGLRDAIDTLEKAQQLMLSSLRCSRCRTQCEEGTMWLCLSCCVQESFPSSPGEDILENHEEISKKFSFCAQCILKFHNGHRIDELAKFRERAKAGLEKRAECEEKVNEMLKKLKIAFAKQLDPSLIQPLRSDMRDDLRKACDAITNDDETIEREAKRAVEMFTKRLEYIEANIGIQLRILMMPDIACSSRYDRPTML